jgi:DNA-directed RNA polymerase subunit RPC12/RpoP
MVICPNCKTKIMESMKTWKYGKFGVHAYLCNNCGAKFNVYDRDGKQSFVLKLQKGKYVKV